MADKHFDKEEFPRKGFFAKDDPKPNPHPNYRKSTKDGFLGARWEAHHVIPYTALDKSILDQPKDLQEYIDDVKWITDWSLNDPANMLGLAAYVSYAMYYQAQDGTITDDSKLSTANVAASKARRYLNSYFNRFKSESREAWVALKGDSPENYPIHQPTNFGHKDYDKRLRKVVTKQVWNSLSEKKDKHEVDAENVKALLEKISGIYKKYLQKRGQGANREKWDKRFDMSDTSWFKPFTMDPAVKKNPLFN